MPEKPPNFVTFQPEPIPREYLLDFELNQEPRSRIWLGTCTVNKILPIVWEQDDEEKQTIVSILRVSSAAPFPEQAQYAAFRQAAYYIEYGILPKVDSVGTSYDQTIEYVDYDPDFADQQATVERVILFHDAYGNPVYEDEVPGIDESG